MKRASRMDLFLVGLTLLLVGQMGYFAYQKAAPAVTPGDRPGVGDQVAELAIADRDGRSTTLASSAADRTLLMVFHSECAWCEQVAPAWRAWLEAPPDGVHILAVSREPIDDAIEYASRKGWKVPVGRVEVVERGSVEHALMSRTPWLFLLDADGVIEFEAQGAELQGLEAALDQGRAYLTEDQQ